VNPSCERRLRAVDALAAADTLDGNLARFQIDDRLRRVTSPAAEHPAVFAPEGRDLPAGIDLNPLGARERAGKFSAKHWAGEFVEFCREVVGRGKAAP